MYANQDKVIDFASFSGKAPPQSIEAEESILGGILFDSSAMNRVKDILQPNHFYVGAHQHIYRAMLKLCELERPTDLIAVADWLATHELLRHIGGKNKLANLVDRCVSAVNVDFLAELVVNKWKRRELGRL